MGYANPVERYGQDAFVAMRRCASRGGRRADRRLPARGVRGALPPRCEGAGHGPIFLLAPTSTEARMAQVGRLPAATSTTCRSGVTGAGHLDTGAVADMVPRIRRHVSVPVGVGFGIRDAATAKAVGAVSDAVVIGSKSWSRTPRERQPADNAGPHRRGLHRRHPRRARHSLKERETRVGSTNSCPQDPAQGDPADRRSVPEGLWIKCPSCETVLYKTDLEQNVNVCPKCSTTTTASAPAARLDAFLDGKGATRSARKCCRWTPSSSGTAKVPRPPQGSAGETPARPTR